MTRPFPGATIFRRLWYDAVWSKVIAAGILGLISWFILQHFDTVYIWSSIACGLALVLGIVIGHFTPPRTVTGQDSEPKLFAVEHRVPAYKTVNGKEYFDITVTLQIFVCDQICVVFA
jgi:hypothetical protein